MVIGRTRDRLAGKTAGSTARAALAGGRGRAKRTREIPGSPTGPKGFPYARYGLLALGGFALGLLLGNPRKREGAPPSPARTAQEGETSRPDDDAVAAARRDEELDAASPSEEPGGDREATRGGSETGARAQEAEGGAPPASPSEPAARQNLPDSGEDRAAQGGVEGEIRARIGGDPRTSGVRHLSVSVDDNMVTIEGTAPSVEVKEALTEVVRDIEGVNIVVNRVRANPT